MATLLAMRIHVLGALNPREASACLSAGAVAQVTPNLSPIPPSRPRLTQPYPTLPNSTLPHSTHPDRMHPLPLPAPRPPRWQWEPANASGPSRSLKGKGDFIVCEEGVRRAIIHFNKVQHYPLLTTLMVSSK